MSEQKIIDAIRRTDAILIEAKKEVRLLVVEYRDALEAENASLRERNEQLEAENKDLNEENDSFARTLDLCNADNFKVRAELAIALEKSFGR